MAKKVNDGSLEPIATFWEIYEMPPAHCVRTGDSWIVPTGIRFGHGLCVIGVIYESAPPIVVVRAGPRQGGEG